MLDVKKRSATSNLSEISGLTGLAPAGPIKEEEVDYSCLEWGDMDPAYRRELEQKPEVKKALQNFKRQAKAARLTPSGEFVEPNLEIPTPNNPPSLDEELKQVEITGSSLETALKSYHERHVQPSFNMLADALTAVSNKKAPSVLRALNLHQMQLSNLEGEICHRTVILHNVPPFANYKSIQGNMRYLCQAASMDFHEVVQSCSSHILSSNEAILRVVFLQQQGSREFLIAFRKSARYWRDYQDRANDRKLRIERDVPFSTRLERQPYFALLDMLSDLTPAPYGSNTFRTDLSSLQIKSPEDFHEDVVVAQIVYLPSRGEFRCILLVQPDLLPTLQAEFGARFNDAFHMFPYAIEYHALDAYCDKANILAGSLAWYNPTAARGTTTANRLSVFVLSDAAEDTKRKREFWDHLSEQTLEVVMNWTTLDYVISNLSPSFEITDLGSIPGNELADQMGKLHSTKQKPEVFCKYLTQHVWKSAGEQMPPQSMLHPVIPEFFRPFTEEDLYQCMKQLQVGKATGPDGIPAELIKRAPYVVQKFILSHYNKCLRTGSIPDAWLLSEVVMLVKDARKDTLSLDNYRPISLTDVFYKLYAFDSVSFAAIERSLVRLGVPAAFVRAVMAIYNNPQFRVKDSGSTSEVGVQSRGVRQGCPLSPYLFDIILTCLFADVEASYEEQFGILTGVLRYMEDIFPLQMK
ncbi:unnamed protein product [Symbiodinium necroappetens]|uniref:Reverse transcriptase domain-containing protein n=1 Tax=Symbiodinium necroappetens TaxID=1628268 RepID=A0A813C0X1_9DINO|nr:unnamed protein product [Symbiodinium necroappetens]